MKLLPQCVARGAADAVAWRRLMHFVLRRLRRALVDDGGGVMEAPKCRLCGEKHWGSCTTFGPKTPMARAQMTPMQRKPVAQRAVMPVATSQSQRHVAFAAEIEALQAEVKTLKRQLAEANAKRVDTTSPDGVASTSTGECPTCKARRIAKALAQRTWRSGKRRTKDSKVGRSAAGRSSASR